MHRVMMTNKIYVKYILNKKIESPYKHSCRSQKGKNLAKPLYNFWQNKMVWMFWYLIFEPFLLASQSDSCLCDTADRNIAVAQHGFLFSRLPVSVPSEEIWHLVQIWRKILSACYLQLLVSNSDFSSLSTSIVSNSGTSLFLPSRGQDLSKRSSIRLSSFTLM